MTQPVDRPPLLVANGWSIYAHDLFARTLIGLQREVTALKAADPAGYLSHPKARILRRVDELLRIEIPADPGHPKFRLGNTLGPENRGWARAKFLGRFRLFFRFSTARKAIIVCWLNDENTLRKAGSRTDPYVVFKDMLLSGNPPPDWDALFAAVRRQEPP